MEAESATQVRKRQLGMLTAVKENPNVGTFHFIMIFKKSVKSYGLHWQIRLVMMASLPTVAIFGLALVLASSHDWLVKTGIVLLIYLYSNCVMNFFFDERMMKVMPISIYFGSKVGRFPFSTIRYTLLCIGFEFDIFSFSSSSTTPGCSTSTLTWVP